MRYTGDTKSVNKILVGKPARHKAMWMPKSRLGENIQIDFIE
jgi:hypothetical protein